MIVGFWYKVIGKNKFHINCQLYNKAKITPGEPFLETDPKNIKYFHVVLGTEDEPGVCIPFSGPREACEAWIKEIYEVDYKQFDYRGSLRTALAEDIYFLDREVHSKSWEIAEHLREVLLYITEQQNKAEEIKNGDK